jgi:hypothetical protein
MDNTYLYGVPPTVEIPRPTQDHTYPDVKIDIDDPQSLRDALLQDLLERMGKLEKKIEELEKSK